MTIDEAIKHAEEVAEKFESLHERYENMDEDRLLFRVEENECKNCANEHRQLAEWLKELKQLRKQEPCDDTVSREAVKELFQEGSVMGMYHFLGIDELPSVTPARKKGKWIVLKDEYGDICEAICSCCEDNGNHRWKYCHTCGAEMESEE